ncbi:MAG TPA: hypothetical protein VJ957_04965 [Longimicrobiales bacterium]|nr:hypothetical protein [Longimicrobiales bacterium]
MVFSAYLHALVLLGLTVTDILLFFPPAGSYAAIGTALLTVVLGYLSFARVYPGSHGRIRNVMTRLVTVSGWGLLVIGAGILTAYYAGNLFPATWNAGKQQHAASLYVLARDAGEAGDTVSAPVLGGVALAAFADVDSPFLGKHDAFHIAELQLLTGHPDSALARTAVLLAQDSADLLALGLAGEATETMGDTAAAMGYYRRLLSLLGAGIVNDAGHAKTFQPMLAEARRAVAAEASPTTRAGPR